MRPMRVVCGHCGREVGTKKPGRNAPERVLTTHRLRVGSPTDCPASGTPVPA